MVLGQETAPQATSHSGMLFFTASEGFFFPQNHPGLAFSEHQPGYTRLRPAARVPSLPPWWVSSSLRPSGRCTWSGSSRPAPRTVSAPLGSAQLGSASDVLGSVRCAGSALRAVASAQCRRLDRFVLCFCEEPELTCQRR